MIKQKNSEPLTSNTRTSIALRRKAQIKSGYLLIEFEGIQHLREWDNRVPLGVWDLIVTKSLRLSI